MDNILHADIFFFISSVTVGFFLLVIIIVAIYIIKILNDIRKIARLVNEEGTKIVGDIDHFRTKLRSKEFDFSVKSLFVLAKNFLKSKFLKDDVMSESRQDTRNDMRSDMRSDLRDDMRNDAGETVRVKRTRTAPRKPRARKLADDVTYEDTDNL